MPNAIIRKARAVFFFNYVPVIDSFCAHCHHSSRTFQNRVFTDLNRPLETYTEKLYILCQDGNIELHTRILVESGRI